MVSVSPAPARNHSSDAHTVSHAAPRGFVLHVDLGTEEFASSAADVIAAAGTLRELIHEWLPRARTRTALTSVDPRARDTGEEAECRPSLRERLDALPDVPPIDIDQRTRTVRVSGRTVHLTGKEFDLFAYLVAAGGRTVTRDELHRTVWDGRDLPAASRTVDVHIKRLRKVPELTRLVSTVHGVGYRVAPRSHVTVADHCPLPGPAPAEPGA